jgi:hypothetical protein
MRWLARTGRLSSWSLGQRSLAFDLEACMTCGQTQAADCRAGQPSFTPAASDGEAKWGSVVAFAVRRA